MAETPSKRRREDTQVEDIEETKRHKSYNHILSLLDEEEDELNQDLSSLITTLQQELSSPNQENPTTAVTTTVDNYPLSSPSSSFLKEYEEDDKDRVIRHLLEASDDELGIPNNKDHHALSGGVEGGNGFVNGLDGFSLGDGLWEFEDANANYYALLQSELFM